MEKLLTVIAFFTVIHLSAQNKIGVRAGLNFSTITTSELELGESYGRSTGFHFGVNYTYMLTPSFGIRGELLYVQRGTRYDFEDTLGVYNVINPPSASIASFVEIGKKKEVVDISNGYLSIPITAQYQLTPKIEIYGGISIDLLLNPTGRGRLEFESSSRPEDIRYVQSYDYKYRGDEAGEIPLRTLSFNGTAQQLSILVDDEQVQLLRTISAYYKLNEEQKTGNKFNLFDSHLIFGANYFLNKGFYMGLRAQYGLGDVTNNNMDFSVRELNTDGSYILRNDKDRSISAALSFGFRF